mmetsp:Transcript_65833/g.116917  ORF Transcript_65833/g.116917 Transcript_65833/m.116917 type:complete len:226 (-) Transcript_65833:573-1250(-)
MWHELLQEKGITIMWLASQFITDFDGLRQLIKRLSQAIPAMPQLHVQSFPGEAELQHTLRYPSLFLCLSTQSSLLLLHHVQRGKALVRSLATTALYKHSRHSHCRRHAQMWRQRHLVRPALGSQLLIKSRAMWKARRYASTLNCLHHLKEGLLVYQSGAIITTRLSGRHAALLKWSGIEHVDTTSPTSPACRMVCTKNEMCTLCYLHHVTVIFDVNRPNLVRGAQ